MNRIWSFVSALTAGRVYTKRAGEASGVYLTFDDGPHPEHTPRLLELLARHDARATFFLLGENAARHQDLVRRIVSEGHAIGNHSYTHPSFVDISLRRQAQEIDRTERVLSGFDGRPSHPFRPPRGRPTAGTIALCLLRRCPMALWTHDSRDFARDTASVVESLSSAQVEPGDILLFHDDSGTGLDALEVLLPRWQSSGLKFLAL
jgi:peptidoglycan/xylan/chitin deacetylase (PgdA/CDA1 family)